MDTMHFQAGSTATAGAVLFAWLAVSVVGDLRHRRIPNRLVLAGIGAASVLHAFAMLSGRLPLAGPGAWAPALGLLAGGAALMPLYLLRACGAGDVKLLAMVGTFTGAPVVLSAALHTLIAGGALALMVMGVTGSYRAALSRTVNVLVGLALAAQAEPAERIPPLQATSHRLPYAAAIFIGTAVALYRSG